MGIAGARGCSSRSRSGRLDPRFGGRLGLAISRSLAECSDEPAREARGARRDAAPMPPRPTLAAGDVTTATAAGVVGTTSIQRSWRRCRTAPAPPVRARPRAADAAAVLPRSHRRHGPDLADRARARTPATIPAPAASDRQRHVLVVEDNPINQRIAEKMLTRLGYRVDTANNGFEATARMARTATTWS